MKLGKYLSSLTKPELEDLKEKCGMTDAEMVIFKMLCNESGSVEIAYELSVSVPTADRKIKKLKEKIERCGAMEKVKVPVWEKMNLTIEEAAEYSNIGICKLQEIIKDPMCPFVLYIGRKRLIKRREFEKFIEKTVEL